MAEPISSGSVSETPGRRPLTPKDFASDQRVRWCPGCGDFSVLSQLQKTLASLGVPREKCVVVSGIGCSSRFPYYMATYGFHSIHGRAASVATGVKLANPDLSVWVITGDGDGLAIGGNHMFHTLRRNVGVKIILFNNRIYGLTKGQSSPTSLPGAKTKTAPFGAFETPANPVRFALGAGATFVARSLVSDVNHLQEVLRKAADHPGTAFVEVYQNCVVFPEEELSRILDGSTREDSVVRLEQGKPLVFGKNKDRGICWDGRVSEVVSFGSGKPPADLLIHDETAGPERAFLLSQFMLPDFPLPIGVFHRREEPTHEQKMADLTASVARKKGEDLGELLAGPDVWEVKPGNGQ